MTDVQSLAAELRRRQSAAGEPFLVAIDGQSGAGKSTLAESLCRDLNAALVCGDDFFAGGTRVREDSPENLARDCLDRKRLLAVLQALKAHRTARYHAFDWDAFDGSTLEDQTVIQPRPLIILEGVYTNHPDFRSLVGCSILLLVAEEERVKRLLRREGTITDWERQWHAAEDWYFANLASVEDFDIVSMTS